MKRALSLILVIAMLAMLISNGSVAVFAADASHLVDATTAANRTNALVNALVGKYFTTSQGNCGNSKCDACYNVNVVKTTWLKNATGFVPSSADLLPEHYWSSTGTITSNAWSCAGFANYCLWYIYAKNPTDNVRRVNIYTGEFTKADMDASGVRTGDVIRVNNDSGGHSFVYISHNSSGVTVLDSNFWTNSTEHNLVKKHVISWDWHKGWRMAVTRGQNWTGGTGFNPDPEPDVCTCSTSYKGTYTTKNVSSELRIRDAHSTNGNVVGYIPAYATFTVSKANGSWAHVTYNGKSGYVAQEYIQPIDDYVVDTRYPTPFKAYTLQNAKQPAYDAINGNNIGNIYTSDMVTVEAVYTNGWVKAKCPWDGYANDRTIYAPLSTFLNTSTKPETIKAVAKTQCYFRSDLSSSPGYIYANDNCVKVGQSGDYYCVLCPWNTGGYYLVWSYKSAFAHTHAYDSWAKYDGTYHSRNCACGNVEKQAHAWNSGTVTKQATCTAAGVKTYTCTVCTATKTETISVKDHTWDNGTVKVAATCGDNGVRTYKCSGCGGTFDQVIPATGNHTYDNECDTTCNICDNLRITQGHVYSDGITTSATCGADGVMTFVCDLCGDSYTEAIPATGEHTYDNACDTTCNVCGDNRTVGAHAYSSKVTTAATCGANGVKTYTCSACGDSYTEAIPATGEHTYDNACDTTCNVCGDNRTVGAHAYSSKVTTAATCGANGVKTYTCSACGDSYTETIPATGEHTYDNACDTTCNVCGDNRTVGAHAYSSKVTTAATCGANGVKTYTCSACGDSYTEAIPATGEHTYDDDYDASCNTCGGVREVPEKPPVNPDLPADAPAFVVESTTAREGEEFTIAIRTERNSGIVSFKLKLAYDADVLELVSVKEKDFVGMSFSPFTNNPITLNWVDAINPDNTTNGVVALVTFRVKEGVAVDQTDITISYNPDDVYKQNFDNVAFRVENGVVEIVEYTPGDVNNDGKVNNKDLGVLQQYLNEWDVVVNEKAADANGDGKVNNKDLGILQQYLNEWDVTLG